jgi:hypothetical protein
MRIPESYHLQHSPLHRAAARLTLHGCKHPSHCLPIACTARSALQAEGEHLSGVGTNALHGNRRTPQMPASMGRQIGPVNDDHGLLVE